MKQYDAIIIGFGKGGKTLAGAFAAAGKHIALIEQSEQMYGGTCINVGCIPSKTLKTRAEQSAKMGGSFSEKARRYTEAVLERERVTSMLREKNYRKLASHPNIEILNGRASFQGKNKVEVTFTGGKTELLEAELIFINTGSSPRIPAIAGVSESRYVYTSETLMALSRLPERLTIIGGGYIGLEFASMYANFGAKVTILQDGNVFLPREDEEIAAEVLKRLQQLGVEVLFSANTRSIADRNGSALLTVETEQGMREIEADAVLLAAGRIPNTADLNLSAAGIALTERGAVVTEEHLRTTNPAVYAMGDVTGGLQFTYISLDDFRIVKSAVLGGGERTTSNRGAVPYSVFLDPPFSRVGLREKDAIEQGYRIKVGKMPAAAIPKAQVLNETAGLLKVIVDAQTDRILGAHLFCAESHEMINLIKLAIDAKIPYQTLRDGIYTHPTMTESFNDLFASLS